jgi:hypothetical protein
VPYIFAPVIGLGEGGTGATVSVACRGSCGRGTSGPVDIVVLADRTGSMSANLTTEQNAILGAMETMDPNYVHVAVGALGYATRPASGTGSGCAIWPGSGSVTLTRPSSPQGWLPLPLSNTFGGKYGLNLSDDIVRELKTSISTSPARTCFSYQSSGTGTWLTTPLRVASRYLLNMTPTGITGGQPLQANGGKAIIFETDGDPGESNLGTFSAGSPLGSSANVGSSSSATACSNFSQVATAAKAAGVLIAFVKYGTGACDLTAAASPHPTTGLPMVFTASDPSELAAIYKDAFTAVSTGSRLVTFPQPDADVVTAP